MRKVHGGGGGVTPFFAKLGAYHNNPNIVITLFTIDKWSWGLFGSWCQYYYVHRESYPFWPVELYQERYKQHTAGTVGKYHTQGAILTRTVRAVRKARN